MFWRKIKFFIRERDIEALAISKLSKSSRLDRAWTLFVTVLILPDEIYFYLLVKLSRSEIVILKINTNNLNGSMIILNIQL